MMKKPFPVIDPVATGANIVRLREDRGLTVRDLQTYFGFDGKAVNSIIVAVVRKFVLLIPLIYIMPHMISDSTTGVYMAEPIADITAVIFTSVLFTFQFKKALAEIQN